jgi:hypothetical protein
MLFLAVAVSGGCGAREASTRPPLAAVLRNAEDWRAAYHLTADMPARGALLSATQVVLGVVELAGGSEQVTCTEHEHLFVVSIASGWIARRGSSMRRDSVLPELHCRVLDASNRPVRFLGLDLRSYVAFSGGPSGIRWSAPLDLVFSRTGRDLARARVIVTSAEAEATFVYDPSARAPNPGVERSSDD